MSTGHYIKPPASGHTPATWASVVVEPFVVDARGEECGITRTAFGRVHVVASRRDHGVWRTPTERTFDDSERFWAWFEGWAQPGRKVYVFSPTATDALTHLRFWERVDRLGGALVKDGYTKSNKPGLNSTEKPFAFSRLVMRGKPDIVEYRFNQRSYLWMSGFQFFDLDHEELAKAVGFRRACETDYGVVVGSSTWTYPEQAQLWHHAARQLGDWWGELRAGGFGRTIGAMAKNFLFSRTPPRTVSTHKDPRTIKLERLACHGGRASTWFYGDAIAGSDGTPPPLLSPPSRAPWCTPEKLFHVDVRSMYPFLLSSIRTPVKRITHRYDMTPKDVADHLPGCCAVAYVSLTTDVAEYPHRRGGFVVYPRGRFRSVLCGTELASALAEGAVTKVHQCALYTSGTPFAAAASELLRMRQDARSKGNTGWEAFVKLLSNSLTGKLAQRTHQWIPRPGHGCERDWGEWFEGVTASGAPIRWRGVAGMAWERDPEPGGVGLLTAVYAHITAAGRDWMRRLRELCPARTVYSQDTDGIWVSRSGLDALLAAGRLADSTPGTLREVESSTATHFYSPKHYYAAGRWVLSGLHNPTPVAADLSAADSWTDNPVRRSCDGPPSVVDIHSRSVELATVPHDGTIGPDGWAIPLTLPARPPLTAQELHDAPADPTPEFDWDAA